MVANVQTMMYYKAGGVPWHGLGKALANPPTSREAIVAAGLDWTVERVLLTVATGPTAEQTVPDAFGIVRSDNGCYLSTVGSKYTPVQNADAFEAVDGIIGEGATYETAGALGRGERVWLLARLPGDIAVKGSDIIRKYICFVNSHDGRTALREFLTPVRVVCQNTLTQALNSDDGSASFRICHFTNVKDRMEEAKRAFRAIIHRYDCIAQLFNALAAKSLNGENRKDIVYKFIPKGEQKTEQKRVEERGRILWLMERGRGNDALGIAGTAWAAYNGMTEYVDHWLNGVENNEKVTVEKLSARWNRIAFGVGATRKMEALDIVREVAGV